MIGYRAIAAFVVFVACGTGCNKSDPALHVTDSEKAVADSRPPINKKKQSTTKDTLPEFKKTPTVAKKSPVTVDSPMRPKRSTYLDEEDPEVVAYFKQQKWEIFNGPFVSGAKPTSALTIFPKDLPPGKSVFLSAEDCAMIGRARTLQMLDIRGVKADDEGITSIVRTKGLEVVLLVSGPEVTDAGAKALATLPKLEQLHLTAAKMGPVGLEAISSIKTLRRLTIRYTEGLSDEGVSHLTKLSNLEELVISGGFGKSQLTTAGIRAIAEIRVPPAFQFPNNLLDDDLLDLLIRKGWIYGPASKYATNKKPATPDQVTHINLEGSRVTDKGLRLLQQFPNVGSLWLHGIAVTDESLKLLASFKKLTRLDLTKTKVKGPGLHALIGLPINYIAIEEGELTESAFEALGKLALLEELSVTRSKLKSSWMLHIVKLPKLKKLRFFQVEFDGPNAEWPKSLPASVKVDLVQSSIRGK